MRIIDIHAHVFPEKVAQRAVESIGAFYGLEMEAGGHRNGGTCADLLRSGGEINVSRYVIHSVATRPDQARSINEFIAASAQAEGRFIGYGTLHPFMEGMEREIDRFAALGLRGVKLHPDFQEFDIDDPRAMALYRLAAERRLPVLMHMGDAKKDFSAPIRMRRVLDALPDVTMIGAHFGGYQRWDEAWEHLVGQNLYLDTSSALFCLEPQRAVEFIRTHGFKRMLWGSDYPMWLHQDELARFMALDLTQEERGAILYDNAAELLDIK